MISIMVFSSTDFGIFCVPIFILGNHLMMPCYTVVIGLAIAHINGHSILQEYTEYHTLHTISVH